MNLDWSIIKSQLLSKNLVINHYFLWVCMKNHYFFTTTIVFTLILKTNYENNNNLLMKFIAIRHRDDLKKKNIWKYCF